MSFGRYSDYRDSGVKWLGQIPKHWNRTQLKRAVDPTRKITYGIVQAGPHVPDGVPYVRPADMTDENGIAEPDGILRTSREVASAYGRSRLRSGDLVCSIGPSFGKVMITPDWLEGGNLTQGTARIAAKSGVCSRFLFWCLRCDVAFAQWESSVGGATFGALNLGPLCETHLPLPSEDEQKGIANFLDRETAKIDALISEQQHLIELLKEKRQAVISHAVTKGLNPNPTLKHTGIEWLGDIPSHWKVGRLSYYGAIENGCTPSRDNLDYWNDGSIPWLSSGEVNQHRIIEAGEFITAKALEECSLRLLPKGTVLIGMIGQGKTRGLSAYLGIEATINQNLAAIVPGKLLKSEFLLYSFETVYEYLREFGRGGNQAALNCEILSALRIPIPPMGEQEEICEHLAARLNEFDMLTAEACRGIGLLQERRTALISAAVTGQIDVRNLATQEAA